MARRIALFASALLAVAFTLGCATLDEKQRAWIFQPSDRSWGGSASLAEGMEDVWIDFDSKVTGEKARLHALWLPAENAGPDAPVILYLHGARWNVHGSAGRMRRLQEMGFGVLGIDYRGFGKSSAGLPSEASSYEDARQAGRGWQHHPKSQRYVFGHSLGGAIAIDLAANVEDEKGTIVEGTFTSIPDVASSFKWGWLPIGPFITQRFSSVDKVAKIGSPLLVVHGANDTLIRSELAQRLFDAATGKKQFLLVEGGSHHSTMYVGQARYREAIQQLFSLR